MITQIDYKVALKNYIESNRDEIMRTTPVGYIITKDDEWYNEDFYLIKTSFT